MNRCVFNNAGAFVRVTNMAKTNLFYGALLSGTMISGMFGTLAFAADVGPTALPAVSAVNGKVEFQGGWADSDAVIGGSDELFYGGAALSIPLGESFGLQGDVAVANVFGDTAVGGTAHLFTRDPNSYLLGAIGGYVDFNSGDMLWGGGEAELYMDNITIQAVAGVTDTDSDFVGVNTGTEFLGLVDLSFYATENLRFIAGASSVNQFESAGLGMEWMLQDQLGMPLSLKADARIGEDDFIAAKAGVTFYFGGNEEGKSLIRRHREDDPPIRAFIGQSGVDIFGSGVLGGCVAQWVDYEAPCYIPEPY
jgi:hypothetical protein